MRLCVGLALRRVFLVRWILPFFVVFSEHWTTKNRSTMICQPGNEKTAEASVAYMLPTQPEAMADEPQIKRTRKILMIITGVCIVSNCRVATLIMYSKRPNVCLLGSLGDLYGFCHIRALSECFPVQPWACERDCCDSHLNFLLQFWLDRESSTPYH